jgi:hypothetical protein
MKTPCVIISTVFFAITINIAAIPAEAASESEAPDLYRSTAEAENRKFSGVEAEIRNALVESDMLVRIERVAGLLQQLGPESAQQVLAIYETVWMELGQTELVLLADWWARFDPHAAMDWAESDFRTAGTNVPLAVLRSWARNDHNAAMARALMGGKGASGTKGGYVSSAIEGWAESGKPGIMEYVQLLGHGMDRQRLLRGITLRKVMREGIAAAFEWADEISEEDKVFKLNVIRRVASNSALIDPALTAKFCSGYDNTYYINSLPQRVAMRWAKKDPVATLAWLRTINDLDARDTGVREAYRLWLRYDRAAANEWVTNDEHHERWKDEAVAMYARRSQLDDPETALGFTERIVSEDLRIATQVVIAKTWKVKDPAEAKAWVENESGMTPPEKARTEAITTRQRLRILYVLEMQAGLTEDAAKERLEDWSDPDVKRTPQEKSERLRSPSPTIQKMRH